jgi:hypothetical protein
MLPGEHFGGSSGDRRRLVRRQQAQFAVHPGAAAALIGGERTLHDRHRHPLAGDVRSARASAASARPKLREDGN